MDRSVDDALAAALLQLARIKAGMTQQELAACAGVPRSMVSAYERSLRQPTVPTLLRLLRAAGFELTARLEPYVAADDPDAERQTHWSSDQLAAYRRELDRWRDAIDRQPTR